MENLTGIKEILFQKLEIPYAESDLPSTVFDDFSALVNENDLSSGYENDDDEELPVFYEVDEPLEVEPDDDDFLTGVGSVMSSGDFTSPNPNLSNYWSIEFDEAGTITIQVLREEADFDPALWIVEGTVFDPTSQFGGEIDFGDPNVVAFADDELPPATGIGTGPFGDPSIELTGQEGDIFTLIVTNFLSGPNTGGDGMFNYTLTIS